MSTTVPLVMQAKGLVKRYGQVTALDGTDFELRAGEILAVIGDNGAGKSSLIKCLSGATIPSAGEIWLDGVPIHFKTPMDARRAGIETVYQDLAVAPESALMRVDFPAPLSPMTARISPEKSRKSAPSSAVTWP
jgi:fructose transport system ATP-binding protein